MTQKNIPEKINTSNLYALNRESWNEIDFAIADKINEIIDFLTPEVQKEERCGCGTLRNEHGTGRSGYCDNATFEAGQKDERERVRKVVEKLRPEKDGGIRALGYEMALEDILQAIGE